MEGVDCDLIRERASEVDEGREDEAVEGKRGGRLGMGVVEEEGGRLVVGGGRGAEVWRERMESLARAIRALAEPDRAKNAAPVEIDGLGIWIWVAGLPLNVWDRWRS